MSTQAIPQTAVSTWNLDAAHSVAEFKVKHMMISNVKGQFAKVTGVLQLDEQDITKSKVEASIDATSLNTRDDQRDTHLKSADFFHVEQHPTLSFKSTRVKRIGNELSVSGDLTIRGVTRNVEFTIEGPTPPAKDPWGNTRIGLSATTKIIQQQKWIEFLRFAKTEGALEFYSRAFDGRLGLNNLFYGTERHYFLLLGRALIFSMYAYGQRFRPSQTERRA